MIKSSTDTIIFDYGGVLINIDYQATISAFKNLGISDFEKLYSQAEQSNLFNDIEVGKISAQHFINNLLRILPSGTSANKVVEAWNAMILDIPASSIQLLKDLKRKGYKIYLLSNTNELHIEVANKEWAKVSNESPEEIFDHVYYSHELHLRKPNVEIFNTVCKQQNLNLSSTVFIDDSIQHVEGATKAGLQAIHLKPGMRVQDLFS